jgi:hypothetical protein
MTNYTTDENNNAELKIKFRTAANDSVGRSQSRNSGFGRRRGKSPQQFNGIHRRRNKKMSW